MVRSRWHKWGQRLNGGRVGVGHGRVYSSGAVCIVRSEVVMMKPAFDRVVTHEMANEALFALIASHFGYDLSRGRRARFSVPVQADDDDTVLGDYIAQQQLKDAIALAIATYASHLTNCSYGSWADDLSTCDCGLFTLLKAIGFKE